MKKQNNKIRYKLILIVIGIFILLFLVTKDSFTKKKIQPAGEKVLITQVEILFHALFEDFPNSEMKKQTEEFKKEDRYLTYREMKAIQNYVIEKSDVMKQTYQSAMEKTEEKYKEEYYIITEDWYAFYDMALEVFDTEKLIQKKMLTLLGDNKNAAEINGSPISENTILTNEGIFPYQDELLLSHIFETVSLYQKEGTLLTYGMTTNQDYKISNGWIVESANHSLQLLSGKWLVTIPYEEAQAEIREQVADVFLQHGKIKEIHIKAEKINGKLLAIRNNEMEIEGKGNYVLSEENKVYRLFGTMQEASLKDVVIGYEFTDFVVEDGKIVACLITKEEAMETIRVLLKTSDYNGNYHENAVFTMDSDFVIASGSKTWEGKAGEKITITSESDFFEENRIRIKPKVLTAKTALTSINRSQGTPVYRGSFEMEKTENGLLIVNEVLLEEYLYAVVPSEMPASYPIEALKAQAVCARTYAYRNMQNLAMAEYGANVDDSVAYQVYNNILENSAATKAVKETQGEIILYGEELAGTYYYSTSCGFGTDAEAWSGNKAEDYPYLQAKRMGEYEKSELPNADTVAEEIAFTEYILGVHPTDWEQEEGWYRWDYQVAKLKEDTLLERIQERNLANGEAVLKKTKAGTFEQGEIDEIGTILNVYIAKRNSGGNAEELIIEGTKAAYMIRKEYNIRYVLSDRESDIRKQNGESVKAGTLLPSAYFMIKPNIDKKEIVGYSIRGGGYGHGVGMSQNAAKIMAQLGKSSEEIICFFYEGVNLKKIY